MAASKDRGASGAGRSTGSSRASGTARGAQGGRATGRSTPAARGGAAGKQPRSGGSTPAKGATSSRSAGSRSGGRAAAGGRAAGQQRAQRTTSASAPRSSTSKGTSRGAPARNGTSSRGAASSGARRSPGGRPASNRGGNGRSTSNRGGARVTANGLVAPGTTPRPRKGPTKAQLRRRQERNRSMATVLVSGALLAGLGTFGGYGIGQGVDWVKDAWPDPPVELTAAKVAPPEALDPAGVAEACTPDAVELDLVADATTFTQGDSVDLTLTVTNHGRVPCLVDSATSSMHVVVTGPDGEQVWSSADCAGTDGEPAMLASGWSWDVDARWSGITSSKGCEGKPAKVDPGTYTATMALADVPGAEGDPVEVTVAARPKPDPTPEPSDAASADAEADEDEKTADGDEAAKDEKASADDTGGESEEAGSGAEESEAGEPTDV